MKNIEKEFDEKFGVLWKEIEPEFIYEGVETVYENKTYEIKQFIKEKIKEVVESVPIESQTSYCEDCKKEFKDCALYRCIDCGGRMYFNETDIEDIKKWRDDILKQL